MSGPKPISKQRSTWTDRGQHLIAEGMPPVRQFERNVHDGRLLALIDELPTGWHMSLSFRNHRGENSRYPSWDEIADARYTLLPADLDFVMHLPPADRYVAVHATCFHLHELRAQCSTCRASLTES